MNTQNNGWQEWSKHVLLELERLNSCYEKLDGKINTMREDIATLKVKAGLWGAIGAAIPTVSAVMFILLK
jgi:hypothetical protein